mmetsp:Transcript_59161/g.70591  ORF Transcript_59161/g.70591 Transcript_59161/m.70591 type:complete len:983 (+) Transcript_59161:161-3109(+)
MRHSLVFLLIPTNGFVPQSPFSVRRVLLLRRETPLCQQRRPNDDYDNDVFITTPQQPSYPPQRRRDDDDDDYYYDERTGEKKTRPSSTDVLLKVPKTVLKPFIDPKIKEDVPKETLVGSALTAALLGLTLTEDLALMAVFSAVGGYVSLQPGTLGDVTRSFGDAAVSVYTFFESLTKDTKKAAKEFAEVKKLETAEKKAESARKKQMKLLSKRDEQDRKKKEKLGRELQITAEKRRLDAEKKAKEAELELERVLREREESERLLREREEDEKRARDKRPFFAGAVDQEKPKKEKNSWLSGLNKVLGNQSNENRDATQRNKSLNQQERQQAERDRKIIENAKRSDKQMAQLEQRKAEQDRKALEKLKRERMEAERKAEEYRIAAERAERDMRAAEQQRTRFDGNGEDRFAGAGGFNNAGPADRRALSSAGAGTGAYDTERRGRDALSSSSLSDGNRWDGIQRRTRDGGNSGSSIISDQEIGRVASPSLSDGSTIYSSGRNRAEDDDDGGVADLAAYIEEQQRFKEKWSVDPEERKRNRKSLLSDQEDERNAAEDIKTIEARREQIRTRQDKLRLEEEAERQRQRQREMQIRQRSKNLASDQDSDPNAGGQDMRFLSRREDWRDGGVSGVDKAERLARSSQSFQNERQQSYRNWETEPERPAALPNARSLESDQDSNPYAGGQDVRSIMSRREDWRDGGINGVDKAERLARSSQSFTNARQQYADRLKYDADAERRQQYSRDRETEERLKYEAEIEQRRRAQVWDADAERRRRNRRTILSDQEMERVASQEDKVVIRTEQKRLAASESLAQREERLAREAADRQRSATTAWEPGRSMGGGTARAAAAAAAAHEAEMTRRAAEWDARSSSPRERQGNRRTILSDQELERVASEDEKVVVRTDKKRLYASESAEQRVERIRNEAERRRQVEDWSEKNRREILMLEAEERELDQMEERQRMALRNKRAERFGNGETQLDRNIDEEFD